MYANVCDSRRNIHPWPAHSQGPDVAIRKIPAARREGRGCLGGGGGKGQHSWFPGLSSPLLLPLLCFYLSSGFCAFPEFSVGRREVLGPSALPRSLSSLWFLREPTRFLSHPGSISGASHWRCTPPSPPSSRCRLGLPRLVCKAGVVGGW